MTRARIRRIRFHDLRRTFKTLLLEEGANPLAVEKLLGHRLPAMIEVYWHPTREYLLETVKRLDRILALGYRTATTGLEATGQTSLSGRK